MSTLIVVIILLEEATVKAPPEGYETDAGREVVRLATLQKCLVQQRHRDHAVQLQALELPCGDHPRHDQTNHHRGDQIEEHREAESDRHHQQVLPPHAVDAGEEPPVDDIPTHLHQDSGQDRMGYRLDVAAETQNQAQQDRGAQRPRDRGPAPGARVNHRTQGGPGAGQTTDNARDYVADPLAHQFPVGIVTGAGHRIGDQRGEEAVDRAEERQGHGRLQGAHQKVERENRPRQVGKAGRHIADDRCTGQARARPAASRL